MEKHLLSRCCRACSLYQFVEAVIISNCMPHKYITIFVFFFTTIPHHHLRLHFHSDALPSRGKFRYIALEKCFDTMHEQNIKAKCLWINFLRQKVDSFVCNRITTINSEQQIALVTIITPAIIVLLHTIPPFLFSIPCIIASLHFLDSNPHTHAPDNSCNLY